MCRLVSTPPYFVYYPRLADYADYVVSNNTHFEMYLQSNSVPEKHSFPFPPPRGKGKNLFFAIFAPCGGPSLFINRVARGESDERRYAIAVNLPNPTSLHSVLVTGADGYLGRQVTAALAADRRQLITIVASDVRSVPRDRQLPGVDYLAMDICSPELSRALEKYRVDVVAHLAAVVTPGKRSNRQLEYNVDVLGTENVLTACLKAGVKKIIYTSSGAAYGYHADNPSWLDEGDPIRGNVEFAYSYHKRLVEKMLARYRKEHPELEQLIFRPGFILGAATRNQITNLLDQPRITGLKGANSPFVIIWDQDVVGAILQGIFRGGRGIYNLAGDGILTLSEMAGLLGKPYRELPVWAVTVALWVGKKLGLTQYGPEQVRFLRYRPVLSNRRLKKEFGYTPQKTTRQVFEYYLESRCHGG